ncbi:MAG: hypothetical protein DRI95_16160 [Bacteroidetes bacterium]|nr:MAG: hypothetical protein DRI95_16160 [Bacteroidota bacterium]
MKHLTFLILSIYSITIISCGSSSNSTNVNPHTQQHINMHQEFIDKQNKVEMLKMAKDISGSYSGNLPCADCEEIIYQLQLNEDLSYHSKMVYKGKSDSSNEKTGTFIVNNDLLIQLDQQAGNMKYFKKNGKGLLMLDKDGKEIIGDLAEKYNLLPQVNKEIVEPIESDKQKLLNEKWKKGIDFYASGNEPFWSLDMDLDKDIRFKNLNGLDFIAPAVKPISAMDADVKRFRSITEAGEIIIQLFHNQCTDNMSGEKFYYSVSIDFKKSNETDYKTYKGCGRFVPDPRVHDIWAIIEVDDTIITTGDSKGEHPRLEINITEGMIFGHDGCNSFRGGVEVQNDAILFGNLASTMMACPDMEISTKITKTISNKKLTYKFEDNLVFYHKDKKVMVLKHVD